MISLFLPVYNEEGILENNVRKVYNSLKNIKERFEIFIIDDSSSDRTSEVGERLSKIKDIKYLKYNNGPSRRENLAVSFRKARGDTIVFMDTDLAVDLGALPNLVKNVHKYDIVIGSRYVKGAEVKRTYFRLLLSKFYNAFVRIYFGSRIKDHQCGFKAFKKKVILTIARKLGYDKSFRRGWFWDAEMLILAQKIGYKVLEIPIKWRYGEKSTFNLKRELKMLFYIFGVKKKLKTELKR
ncbi:MAG: glycosyltransferase [Nanoarchaeota archaeon]